MKRRGIAAVFLLLLATLAARATDGAALEAALVQVRAHHLTTARAMLRELAGRQPGDVEVNFQLARLDLWFDDESDAIARLESAALRAPNDARIQNALGDAYGLAAQHASLLGKVRWACKCQSAYERAVALAPGDPAYRWSLLGYCLVAPRVVGGGLDRAEQQAGEIARLDRLAGRMAFATLFLAQHRSVEAFAQLDEELKDQPNQFQVCYQVGRCAAISGEQLERGLQALRTCLTLCPPDADVPPTHANIHYRIGNVLEKKGEHAAAEAEYRAAREVEPDFRPEKWQLKY